jgi:uncharacterized protein YcbX
MFIDQSKRGAARAAVRITLPDGSTVASTAHECNEVLSTILNRAVTLAAAFDGATVHLLTTATLKRLHDPYPQGRFDVPRFRPNLVVEWLAGETGFVRQTWIGHTLAIGDAVQLKITGSCSRCVMTTLAQGDLPKDSGILRTAVQHNQSRVGVYAAVVQGGTIGRGDRVRMSESG